MDEYEDGSALVPLLMESVAQLGKGGAVTLREHLEALRTCADNLYMDNAQAALDGLDSATLAQVLERIEEEEDEPYCIVYHLPDGRLLRIFPEYSCEFDPWIGDEEDEEYPPAHDPSGDEPWPYRTWLDNGA